MILDVAASMYFVFVAGSEQNPVLWVYNAHSVILIVQHDALPNVLLNNFIADETYAYLNDVNNPVVYRLYFCAFVPSNSGEYNDSGDGDDGSDGENSVTVDAVLQIAVAEKCFRKKARDHAQIASLCTLEGWLYQNPEISISFFIEAPSDFVFTTHSVYAILPRGTIPAVAALFCRTSIDQYFWCLDLHLAAEKQFHLSLHDHRLHLYYRWSLMSEVEHVSQYHLNYRITPDRSNRLTHPVDLYDIHWKCNAFFQ